MSDFDLGVVFEKPERYKDKTMEPYLKLYKIFTDVLPKEYLRHRFKMREHEFDIVFLQFAPISFQFSAIKDGKILYGRICYKKNADLQYFYDLSFKAILDRI